jgi:hypothetical protein
MPCTQQNDYDIVMVKLNEDIFTIFRELTNPFTIFRGLGTGKHGSSVCSVTSIVTCVINYASGKLIYYIYIDMKNSTIII